MAPDIVPYLLRAANMLDNVSCVERRRLLVAAAEIIRDYRAELNFPLTDDLGSGDLVFDLCQMAYNIELFGPKAVYEAMLQAVAVIRKLRSEVLRARR
ncbi:hypothetical protein [Mesorhizobium sp. KR2-14]|uniref:hypothetical protein n=1 Tax=Mesorhizobium sp. KR2-14 TaxID=3156610 RepID=UPI0032B4A80D